jgi:hypothetical protein
MVRADSVTAESAGLRYVTDALPGITRERGGGWVYRRPDGSIITDPDERAWIDVIGIPPALDFGSARGRRAHLATGRGSRGRKQYRYHPRWQQVRDQSKYNRVAGFAGALPGLRRRIERDLGLPGLPLGGGARRGDPTDGPDADPHRQRGVRPAERALRPDHLAARPRPVPRVQPLAGALWPPGGDKAADVGLGQQAQNRCDVTGLEFGKYPLVSAQTPLSLPPGGSQNIALRHFSSSWGMRWENMA